MNDIDKLRVLLPHWIEHNIEHGGEFVSWAEKVRASDHPQGEEIAAQLARAVSACDQVTDALKKAMEVAGGPLDHAHGHHHHH